MKQKMNAFTRQTHLIPAKATRFVAQICNLLYRRIAFCGRANIATAPCSATASQLQIGNTAEFNSALHFDVFVLNASVMPLKAKRIFAALRSSILAGVIGCVALGARASVEVTRFDPPLQISANADVPTNSFFNTLGADLDANGEVDFRLVYGLGGIDAFFNAPLRFGQHVSQPDMGNVVQRGGPVAGVPLGSVIGANIVSSVTTNFYVWSPGYTNRDDLTQFLGDHQEMVISAGLATTYMPAGPIITISNGTFVTNIIYPQPIVSGDVVGRDAVMALEFYVNGQRHYGYIHCNFTAGLSGVIYGWAYETEADTAIEAVSLAPSPALPPEVPGKGHSGIVGMVSGNQPGWTVSISTNGTFLKSVKPDGDGYFKVNLAPGTYVLTPLLVPHPGPGQPVPNFIASGTPKTVKVTRNRFTFVVLNP